MEVAPAGRAEAAAADGLKEAVEAAAAEVVGGTSALSSRRRTWRIRRICPRNRTSFGKT